VGLAGGDPGVGEKQPWRHPGLGGGGGGGGGGGIFDHSQALNLSADDHLHYLNRNGVREMAGDLDLDGNDLLNAGNVAYGNIYVTAGAAGQSLTANVAATLTAYTTNGVSLNTTPSAANNRITVTNAGVYRLAGTFTFQAGNNQNVQFFAAVGGAATVIGGAARATTANQPFHASFNGLLALGAGAVVTVLATSSGNTTLTVTESHLTVERVG